MEFGPDVGCGRSGTLTWQHTRVSADADPPRDAAAPVRVIACFLRATFVPLPPRWKQGRLQLEPNGIRWGPGMRGREGGLLLPSPLSVQAVREAHGWEKLHIKASAFQIVEVESAEGPIHVAIPR